MAAPKKILFLSNSELGQANCFLATSHALMLLRPDIEIHFASYKRIRKAVQSTSDYARTLQPKANPIIFHEIKALSNQEALVARPELGVWEFMRSRPTIRNIPTILRVLSRIFIPYSGEELVLNYREIEAIVNEVKADATAVDSFFTVATTVLRTLDVKFTVLSPNTLKDFLAAIQPRGAFFWKYPIVGSGWPYPLPWHLIPLNILFTIMLIYFVVTESKTRRAKKYLKAETGAVVFGHGEMTTGNLDGTKILVSALPELDFPLKVIPSSVVSCGPIVRAVRPVAEVDPELLKWLGRAPTVLINLGSHVWMQEPVGVEMAGAIRKLLDEELRLKGKSELQIIWKMQQMPTVDVPWADELRTYSFDKPGDKIYEILGPELDADRIRIVNWLTVEPFAILQTGLITCNVNHGGANSYWEAFVCGTPQVTLPPWADCYDFAYRGEMLGIGRWGSRKNAPEWAADELGPVLADVVLGPGAETRRARAKELALMCAQKGEGRIVAARELLKDL